eukprot:c18928_g1_i1.p1 GENE.c18928_g1_i1~~c18928_g1_i1.p1  ORF type:complete len:544 (+),score=237.16 c18928_g1_i1:25-1632(+)
MLSIFGIICLSYFALGDVIPSVDVSGWPQSHVDSLVKKLETKKWWFRVGERLFSPALDEDKQVSDISKYRIVISDNKLPHELNKFKVGSNEDFNVHIIKAQDSLIKSKLKNSKIFKPTNKMVLYANLRNNKNDLVTPQLEHDFDEEDLSELIKPISDQTYLDELNALTSIGSGKEHQRNFQAGGHSTAEEYLSCELMERGFEVQVVSFGDGGKNILGCLPGESADFYIAGAHFDTLPRPPHASPGAMDNGSGVAVMMTVMKALASKKFKNTFCVACFDGEELGLVGSTEIAKQISENSKLKGHFLGAITSDMSTGFLEKYKVNRPAGWTTENSQLLRVKKSDPTSDGIHIDGSQISSKLIDAFADAAMNVVTDKEMPIMKSTATLWSSDHKSFLRQNLPAIDICSANHRQYEYWHNEHNTTECITPGIGAEITRTTVAALARLLEIKGSRDSKDLEEDEKANLPQFNSKTAKEEFPSLSCRSFATQVSEKYKSLSVPLSIKTTRDHEEIVHKHQEIIHELEDTIGKLEKQLKIMN